MAAAFDVDVPPWRLLFTRDGTRAVARHWHNSRLECFLPGARAAAAEKAITERLARHFSYCVRGPLSALLSPEFLTAHVRSHHLFSAVSCSSGGGGSVATCAFALLPSGLLVLALDKDTYQQLGLEGSHAPFAGRGVSSSGGGCGAGVSRRYVRIDLAAASFAPGHALYDRVLWCLSPARVTDVSFLACKIDPATGAACEIAFPAGLAAERRALKLSRTQFAALWQPSAAAVARIAATASKADQECAAALFDWAGLLAARSPLLVQTDFDETDTQQQLELVQQPGVCITAEDGCLIPAKLVEDVLAQSAVCTAEGGWVCATAWGFPHSPVSWDTAEHDGLLGGAHGFVAFAAGGTTKHPPFAFCFTSPHDAFNF